MKFWSRYWSWLWDLQPEQEQPEETPELLPAKEQMPPSTARRVLRQSGYPGSISLRQQAAQTLQRITGNRQLSQASRGRPLPQPLRSRLEASFGADLSSVRLQQNEAVAQAMNAQAFTKGDQIIVDQAADTEDATLISHEVAHIAQAQQRGTHPGISQPGGATEQEAQAVEQAISTGQPAHLSQTGGSVPAIQRQTASVRTAPAIDPLVRRESVRIMLLLQYQQQGGQGTFRLTPVLQSELRRLIPDLTSAILPRLWTPEPPGPMEAFQRLVDAGYLPLFAATAQPELTPPEPTPEPKPAERPRMTVSPFGPGGVGIHLTLNPRAPAPLGATIRQQLGERGIPFSYREVQALLQGRDQGAEQLECILEGIAPQLTREQRQALARTIADALLTRSLQAQLTREAPTAIERNRQAEEQLQQILGIPEQLQGDLPSLLRRVPVGASITIHF
jgi:hypothetical protein